MPEVREYFRELGEILYKENYFGFEDSATQYAVDLFDDIEDTLPTRAKKPAPAYFNRYGAGMFYAVFKKNKRTQWYVFFNIYADNNGDVLYLVRYMSNNHMVTQLL